MDIEKITLPRFDIETIDAILNNKTLNEDEKLEKLEKLEITRSDAQGILQAQEMKQRSKP